MWPLSPAIMRSWRRNCLQKQDQLLSDLGSPETPETTVENSKKEHTYGKNNYRMGQPRQRKIYVLLYARQGPDKR